MLRHIFIIALALAFAGCSGQLNAALCHIHLQTDGSLEISRDLSDRGETNASDDSINSSTYLIRQNNQYLLVNESYTQSKTTIIAPLETNCKAIFFSNIVYFTREVLPAENTVRWFGTRLHFNPEKVEGAFKWSEYAPKAEKQYYSLQAVDDLAELRLANLYGLGVELTSAEEPDATKESGVVFFPTGESDGNLPIERMACLTACRDDDPVLSIESNRYYFFGMMDKSFPFEMQLERVGGKLRGRYRYTARKDSAWIDLDGDINGNDLRILEELKEVGTGTFNAKLTQNYIVGTWISPNGAIIRRFLAARQF